MKRRHFLCASLAASGTVLMSDALFAASDQQRLIRELGIQLYTLRNELREDTSGTIAKVAKMSYFQVEPFGFPSEDAKAMIAAAKDEGLRVNSTHFQWDSVVDPSAKGVPAFKEIVEQASQAGVRHLVIPYLHEHTRKSLDDYRALADRFNTAAETAKEAGIQLAYHHHAFEFKPMQKDKTGFDIFVDRFSAQMKFEIDVFWVHVGGRDAAELLRGLTGRVSQVHLKDLNASLKTPEFGSVSPDSFEEVGDGVIAMKPILEASQAAGVEHCHVEQDHSPHPLESIQQSINFLRQELNG